ncbi:MAG: helix-hairpin-helix domain-containing protein [Parcubacteria group bacterium]
MDNSNNKKIAEIFREIVRLLEIKGKIEKSMPYRKFNYQKAAKTLDNLDEDISLIYKKSGVLGVRKALNIGEKMAKKIEEYLKKKKIKDYENLKEDTVLQQIITCFFETKGISLPQLKYGARKRKIIYSRFTKPAKQLLELAGSVEMAKDAINKVAAWANSRNLDYSIETVFKKWLELDRLKPKDIVKKPYFKNMPMVWSESRKKWYVIDDGGNWLEFAARESEIEWRIVK